MPSVSQESSAKKTVIRTSEPFRKRRHLPKTLEGRMDLGVRELRVPATFEEYLAFSQDCDYRVHYREGHIISFIEIDEKTNAIMGEASIIHEALVARLINKLGELFDRPDENYLILGSNIRIFIADNKKGCNADVTVVKGAPEEKEYKFNRRTVKGLVNPWLVVEILSDSTRDFDLSEKLSDYKTIPSLQQVIFLEQDRIWASTYIRVSEREWRNLDLVGPEEEIPVMEQGIGLEAVYRGIV